MRLFSLRTKLGYLDATRLISVLFRNTWCFHHLPSSRVSDVLLYPYCFRRCRQIFGLQRVAGLTQLILEMMIVLVLDTTFLNTFRLSRFQTARSTGSSSQ